MSESVDPESMLANVDEWEHELERWRDRIGRHARRVTTRDRVFEYMSQLLTNKVGPRQLLLRLSIDDPEDRTAYVAFAPQKTSLKTLVKVAGRRWTIGRCFVEAKVQPGLDEYEVRSWRGFKGCHSNLAVGYLVID